jgi:hypothetical protein
MDSFKDIKNYFYKKSFNAIPLIYKELRFLYSFEYGGFMMFPLVFPQRFP